MTDRLVKFIRFYPQMKTFEPNIAAQIGDLVVEGSNSFDAG